MVGRAVKKRKDADAKNGRGELREGVRRLELWRERRERTCSCIIAAMAGPKER